MVDFPNEYSSPLHEFQDECASIEKGEVSNLYFDGSKCI